MKREGVGFSAARCTSLSEFLKGRSQKEVADLVGLTQAAISKMLQKGRGVYICEYPCSDIALREDKIIVYMPKVPDETLPHPTPNPPM